MCSRCAGANHKCDICLNSNQNPMCWNCRSQHIATSTKCPQDKEYQ